MKCYYEVLGIPMNVSPNELKKAYRMLALEWHPDRNLHRIEEATRKFQGIQEAYEILIDPQERAWYDRHKDQILGNTRDTTTDKEDSFDIYPYYRPNSFEGFDDSERSFYSTYRKVFDRIASEEKRFNESAAKMPSFGHSFSTHQEVGDFYAHWQNYCTAKTFVWNDPYNLLEARRCGCDRRDIKRMEKQNKKERHKSKVIRNDEIRRLVAFVKKRDKRIQARKKFLEEQKLGKERHREELRQSYVQERQEILRSFKEPEWSSMSQFESRLDQLDTKLDRMFDSSHAAESPPDYYCVFCNKSYRCIETMKDHIGSGKHKENLALLKTESLEILLRNSDLYQFSSSPSESDQEESKPLLLSDEKCTQSTSSCEIERQVECNKPFQDTNWKREEFAKKITRKKKAKACTQASVYCKGCGITFESRNKLFEQLRTSGNKTHQQQTNCFQKKSLKSKMNFKDNPKDVFNKEKKLLQ